MVISILVMETSNQHPANHNHWTEHRTNHLKSQKTSHNNNSRHPLKQFSQNLSAKLPKWPTQRWPHWAQPLHVPWHQRGTRHAASDLGRTPFLTALRSRAPQWLHTCPVIIKYLCLGSPFPTPLENCRHERCPRWVDFFPWIVQPNQRNF